MELIYLAALAGIAAAIMSGHRSWQERQRRMVVKARLADLCESEIQSS